MRKRGIFAPSKRFLRPTNPGTTARSYQAIEKRRTGVKPRLPTPRALALRRIGQSGDFKGDSTTVLWWVVPRAFWKELVGLELIKDHWKPTVGVTWRFETFCYGPVSCRLYKAGPKPKAPGRRGMSYVEEDWVDDEAVRYRPPEE